MTDYIKHSLQTKNLMPQCYELIKTYYLLFLKRTGLF